MQVQASRDESRLADFHLENLPGLVTHRICKGNEFCHLRILRMGQSPALLEQSSQPDETKLLFP